MDQTSIKSRAALGQIASLGDLYDARTDTFCGISAFKKSIDPETIELFDNHFSEIRLIHKDTFSEKASTLNIGGELQVSILADLFKLSGSGRFLNDEKKSSRSVKSSLLYNITTKYEKIKICHENLEDAFALEAIASANTTHVVVGITWGANTLLTCEYQNNENKDTSEIEVSFSPTLEKIAEAIKGKGNINFNFKKDNTDNSVNNSFDIRIYGDILPQGLELPTTVEDAVNLMKQMPNLVSTCNQGRGNPLIFHMIPISLLKESWKFSFKVDHLIKTLEEESILRVVQFFDQLVLMRQRINDFHHDAIKHKFCVSSESIEKISTLKEEYAIYQAALRSKLAKILTAVRSGTVDMIELENCLRDFKSGQYSPEKLSDIFSAWKNIPEKISFAKFLIQNGAKYIGYGSSFEDEIIKNFDTKGFVLFFLKDEKFRQTDAWKMNLILFLQKVKKGEFQHYFAVDCDIHEGLWPKSGKILQVFQNGQMLSEGLVTEHVDLAPFAKTTLLNMEKVKIKPNKRGRLFLCCTGINCNPTAKYEWVCPKCCTVIEYGFDSYFYCECGRALFSTYKFLCTDPKHGFSFEKFADVNFMQRRLDQLKPFKEINILILGETGVGKSTWINGFLNYLNFDTLQEAEENDLLSLIPGNFTVCDKDYNEITVTTGTHKNEVRAAGQSATQECKIYSFPIENRTIRLIDTPGIGDSRGFWQDKTNFENILKTIANLEELHGICILLKPNNARLNVIFHFCIKHILTYLHRDACRNIMFCFTHSRSTFYQPGDTLKGLVALLMENKDFKISISSDTIYCYDSEAYRFLAGIASKVKFSKDEREDFAHSWDKWKTETHRMLKHIDQLTPLNIEPTLSLNNARELVFKLTRPLAEINVAVLKNMIETELLQQSLSKEFCEIINERLIKFVPGKTERTEAENKVISDTVWAELQRKVNEKYPHTNTIQERIVNDIIVTYTAFPDAASRYISPDLPNLTTKEAYRGKNYLGREILKPLKTKDLNQLMMLLNIMTDFFASQNPIIQHIYPGIIQSVKRMIDENIYHFEKCNGIRLLGDYKWDFHVYCLKKFGLFLHKLEREWENANDPRIVLEKNKDVYVNLIQTRLRYGFSAVGEGHVIANLLGMAVSQKAVTYADDLRVGKVLDLSWIVNAENVRLRYFSHLAREVEKGNNKEAVSYFMSPKNEITKWFVKQVDSIFLEECKTECFLTFQNEMANVIQTIKNKRTMEEIKQFLEEYFTQVGSFVNYQSTQEGEEGNIQATNLDLFKNAVEQGLRNNQEHLASQLTLSQPSESTRVMNRIGCTEYCFGCGALCLGQRGHEKNADSTKNHHACHQPSGLIGTIFMNKWNDKTLVAYPCQDISDECMVFWGQYKDSGMLWKNAKLHDDFKDWLFESHTIVEFNQLMHWFFKKINRDLAAYKGVEPFPDEVLRRGVYANLDSVRLDEILTAISQKLRTNS